MYAVLGLSGGWEVRTPEDIADLKFSPYRTEDQTARASHVNPSPWTPVMSFCTDTPTGKQAKMLNVTFITNFLFLSVSCVMSCVYRGVTLNRLCFLQRAAMLALQALY